MVDDPDAMWKPGSDVRFDRGRPARFDEPSAGVGAGTSSGPPRSHRPWVGVGVVVAMGVGVVAAITVGRGGDGDRPGAVAPVSSPAAAAIVDAVTPAAPRGDVVLASGDVPLLTRDGQCAPRRLPASVPLRWELALPGADRVGPIVALTARSVITTAGVDALIAVDIDTGVERWRRDLASSSTVQAVQEVVGSVDGVVIVRGSVADDDASPVLSAVDEATGDVLWEFGVDANSTAELAEGVLLVATRPSGRDVNDVGDVLLLDPRTGGVLGILPGVLVASDDVRSVVTRAGDKVLTATLGGEREVLGLVSTEAPFAVVDDRLVAAGVGGTELVVTAMSATSGARSESLVPVVGSSGIAAPRFVIGLEGLGASALLVVGDGAVYGAQLDDASVELRWRVAGVVIDSAPSDRGRTLVVAGDGGAEQRVVDSSTGRTIVDVTMRQGAMTTLGLFANGVVLLDVDDGGPSRTAVDLDGRELWTLPGSGPLSVGDGVVVDVVDAGDDGIRIAAYGDPAETAVCSTALREWVPR